MKTVVDPAGAEWTVEETATAGDVVRKGEVIRPENFALATLRVSPRTTAGVSFVVTIRRDWRTLGNHALWQQLAQARARSHD